VVRSKASDLEGFLQSRWWREHGRCLQGETV